MKLKKRKTMKSRVVVMVGAREAMQHFFSFLNRVELS